MGAGGEDQEVFTVVQNLLGTQSIHVDEERFGWDRGDDAVPSRLGQYRTQQGSKVGSPGDALPKK